ncbi:MAG: A24 family peptidase [Pirellulaceae bacterium]|nr:A24 family peptidase [Pirellulaceae bacterium]
MHVGYDFAFLVALYITIAAVVDYRTKKIPNWLTVPAALLGLAFNAFAPHGLGPVTALLGFAVGFGLLLLPWILGGGGMGDVKMLAALGAWLGPILLLVAFAGAAILAAVAATIIIAISTMNTGIMATQDRYIRSSAGAVQAAGRPARKTRRVLPFAVPVAVSTWLVLAWLLLAHSAR